MATETLVARGRWLVEVVVFERENIESFCTVMHLLFQNLCCTKKKDGLKKLEMA